MEEETRLKLELRQHYRNTFDNPSGQVVFHDLVMRSGVLDEIRPEDAEVIGRRNLMLEVIKIIGAYSDNPMNCSEAISLALLKQPIQGIVVEDEERDGIL